MFLTAQSSSRSLVVGRSVCLSVGRPLWKKWPLVYQMLIKSYLPSYLCDSSDSSDSGDSSDISDSGDSGDNSDSGDTCDSGDSDSIGDL